MRSQTYVRQSWKVVHIYWTLRIKLNENGQPVTPCFLESRDWRYCRSIHLGILEKWKSLSRVRLCDPMDYTVHGILQSRILEWVAFPFPRDLPNTGIEPRSPASQEDSLPSKPPGTPKNTGVGSHSLLQGIFPTQGTEPRSPALQGDSLPAEPPGKPKIMGSLSLLQWIFLTQESNRGLLLHRWILDQLSYQGFLKTEGKSSQFLCQDNYINRCPGWRDLDCRKRESPMRESSQNRVPRSPDSAHQTPGRGWKEAVMRAGACGERKSRLVGSGDTSQTSRTNSLSRALGYKDRLSGRLMGG